MLFSGQSSLRVREVDQPDKYNMPKRKVWSEEEDKILKFLRQERKVHKWEKIARIMQQEFSIAGRSGKQCRERYHNHLDSAIVTTEWLPEEQEVLLAEHEEIGNKWSAISQKLPGRSDNCVKNHFYSKLRKSIRRLNKIIEEQLGKEHNQIKLRTLSKIIEVQQTKFKINSKVDEELADFCKNIKNRLFVLEDDEEQREEGASEQAHRLIADIHWFQNNEKKGYRAAIKREHGQNDNSYLKPPSWGVRRSRSISSDQSDDSNSYLSSASYVSSISDLSEIQDNKKSKTTRSRRGSSGLSSENREENNQDHDREGGPMEMAPQDFIRGHGELIEEDEVEAMQGENFANELFNGMMYEDTPVMARIFAPSLHFNDGDFHIFPRQMEIDDEPIQLQEPPQNN